MNIRHQSQASIYFLSFYVDDGDAVDNDDQFGRGRERLDDGKTGTSDVVWVVAAAAAEDDDGCTNV